MGGGHYDTSSRLLRARTSGFHTKSRDEIFTQQKERRAHKEMDPKGIKYRECCDSEDHPEALPIVLGLDLTGSMGHIPHELVKEGLPTLMGDLTQNGVPDAAVCFVGVGDHECDDYPLQVGQFESADKELDLWLTRTYLEGGGGGNVGESYLLAWYFAANHTKTDAWDKRKQKGFLITIGDEPCLKDLPKSAVKEIMGDTATGQISSAEGLLKAAQERYNVYHIHIDHRDWDARRPKEQWKELLGQNCIVIKDYRDVAKTVANLIRDNLPEKAKVQKPKKVEKTEAKTEAKEEKLVEEIL